MPEFIFFTDPHLIAEAHLGYGDGRSIDTVALLERVLDALKTVIPAPSFAVLGGDLATPDLLDINRVWSAQEYIPSYRLLRERLRSLPFPVYTVLGNHDNRDAFHSVFETGSADPAGRHFYSWDLDGFHFVVLDSLHPGAAGGDLGKEQLDWLKRDLSTHMGRPTVLFLHHHPWEIGLRWLDEVGLRDGEELLELLGSFPQVQSIFCGHAHLEHSGRRGDLSLYVTPSTSFQICPRSHELKFVEAGPAFRWVSLQPGALSTRVIAVSDSRAAPSG